MSSFTTTSQSCSDRSTRGSVRKQSFRGGSCRTGSRRCHGFAQLGRALRASWAVKAGSPGVLLPPFSAVFLSLPTGPRRAKSDKRVVWLLFHPAQVGLESGATAQTQQVRQRAGRVTCDGCWRRKAVQMIVRFQSSEAAKNSGRLISSGGMTALGRQVRMSAMTAGRLSSGVQHSTSRASGSTIQ